MPGVLSGSPHQPRETPCQHAPGWHRAIARRHRSRELRLRRSHGGVPLRMEPFRHRFASHGNGQPAGRQALQRGLPAPGLRSDAGRRAARLPSLIHHASGWRRRYRDEYLSRPPPRQQQCRRLDHAAILPIRHGVRHQRELDGARSLRQPARYCLSGHARCGESGCRRGHGIPGHLQ